MQAGPNRYRGLDIVACVKGNELGHIYNLALKADGTVWLRSATVTEHPKVYASMNLSPLTFANIILGGTTGEPVLLALGVAALFAVAGFAAAHALMQRRFMP